METEFTALKWWLSLTPARQRMLSGLKDSRGVSKMDVVSLYLQIVKPSEKRENISEEQEMCINNFLSRYETKPIRFALLTENKDVKQLYQNI